MQSYRLTIENVNRLVPRNATGAYFLGHSTRTGFFVEYVGRSDTRLRERLMDHAANGWYQRFSFQITETILEAFRIECREWHNAYPLDNKVHPRKPKNLDYLCPYCITDIEGFGNGN